MAGKFVRKKEDFVCENCGKTVEGNGYTNHCPSCLFSKHVDINPGDRLSLCDGMMRPIGFEKGKKGLVIMFVCEKCGHRKKNRMAEGDNLNVLIELSKGRRGQLN